MISCKHHSCNISRDQESGGDMDSYSIKSVTFGGFDKLDVVRYIESLSKTAAGEKQDLEARVRELEDETQRLQDRTAELESQIADLQARLDETAAQRDKLSLDLEQETARREALEPMRDAARELEALREEVEALRHDANAYAQFRSQVGAIECEARERANTIEIAAAERVRRTVSAFHEQYQDLMQIFESTATHVTGELRKVQVNLTQLPRVMDQADTELKAMTDQMRRNDEEEAPPKP